MSFILRILFSGMIALVPNEDGTELNVLLLNAHHGYHLSDGSALAQHKPLLVARAGNCTGDCPKRDAGIAQFLFADQSLTSAQDSLETAVAGGGAWALNASEVSVRKATGAPDLPPLSFRRNVRGSANGQLQVVPTTATEREDYSWQASFSQLCAGCTLKPSVLAQTPPANLIAARLRLKSGNVFTYSVARIGNKVVPVHFGRLDGEGSAASYSQALAGWMAAEIQVQGSSVEIVDTKFDGSSSRTMSLSPGSSGKVEVAVLNQPPFVPPASPSNNAPQVGKHFELYYELVENPPAREARLVPRPGPAPGAAAYPDVTWQSVHPTDAVWSDLLNKLRLDVGRGARTVYERALCPTMGMP